LNVGKQVEPQLTPTGLEVTKPLPTLIIVRTYGFALNVAVLLLDVEQVNTAGQTLVEYPVFGVQTGVTDALYVQEVGVAEPLTAVQVMAYGLAE
jgi:hypothetical protein